jgi:hypothetical protein
MQLSVESRIIVHVCQSEVDQLWNSARVLTKSPTDIKTVIYPASGRLFYMVYRSLVTENYVCYLLEPGVFEADLLN